MKYKGKTIKVKITGDAETAYKQLNETVGKEVSSGVQGSDHQTLFNAIKQKIEFIRTNPEYGTHITKKKIPVTYLRKYDITNLWKVNLSGAWRMLYTIRGDEVEIIALILDILNHKDYEKKLNYKKS